MIAELHRSLSDSWEAACGMKSRMGKSSEQMYKQDKRSFASHHNKKNHNSYFCT